jgi:hypothetical protein
VKFPRLSHLARIIILGVFLVFTVIIAFGHTEKTPADESRCVACHYLGLLLQTAPSAFVFLVSFFFLSLIRRAQAGRKGIIVSLSVFLRAPPTV